MVRSVQSLQNRALQVPLFWLAISAIVGIISVDLDWRWSLGLFPLAALFIRKKAVSLILLGSLLVAWAGFGWLHHGRIKRVNAFPLLSTIETQKTLPVSGRGWVVSDKPQKTGQAVRVILKLDELEFRGTQVPLPNRDQVVALIDHPFSVNLAYGAEVGFTGELKKIGKAQSPGAFDPSAYFYRSANALAEISIDVADRCDITGRNPGGWLRKAAISSRVWMEEALKKGIPDGQSEMNGIILAMALGAREKSPDDVEDFFRLSGTMHIFAVSGLHVGVVAGMFWFLLKWMGVTRRSSVILIIPGILFYALLTGLSPSSFRAGVMLAACLAGFALKQRSSSLNGIGLAALILLAVDSQPLFLPGFQLSFCVVLALSLMGVFLSKQIHRPFGIDEFIPKRRVQNWRLRIDQVVKTLAAGTGISVASWLGSLALMSSHFHGISIISIIANIFMVPLASAIVVVAGISVLFYGLKLGFVSAVINFLNVQLAALLVLLAQFFAGWPGAHLHTGGRSIKITPDAVVLDVMGIRGGGAVLATSQSGNWMIDCGGNLTFRQQMLPLLRERGINRIDYLVLTHGDSGHIGAAPYLLNYITPKWVIESRLDNRSRTYPEIRAIVETKRINRMEVEAGQKLRWGGQSVWEVIYPGVSDPPTGVADDGCLVLRLKTGPWKILFTSDCGFLTEQRIIEENWGLKSDIWIRGQHSETHSGTRDFLEKIDPKIIISSHARFPPHEKLADEWISHVEKVGIQLIKLDEIGSVNLEITSQKILVQPFLTGERIELRR